MTEFEDPQEVPQESLTQMVINKRQFQRASWDYPVELNIIKGNSLAGEIKNISEGGIKVVSSDTNVLEVGDVCEFKCRLSEKDPTYVIKGKAIVAWKQKMRLVGLQFIDIDNASHIFVQQILSFLGTENV